MEREILYRGKLFDGEWIEGVPVSIDTITCIFKLADGVSELKGFQVNPSTVGQYTGLTDKNGVKIFEGDVCRFQNVFSSKPHIGVVRYYASAKPISDDGQYSVDLAECNSEDLEVIGNIHDNPEMLKGK